MKTIDTMFYTFQSVIAFVAGFALAFGSLSAWAQAWPVAGTCVLVLGVCVTGYLLIRHFWRHPK